jgi:hypothetical protein
MVELIKAPSKLRYNALTLSTYKFISMIFCEDIAGILPFAFFSNRASDYLLDSSTRLNFLRVDLVDESKDFFLKSTGCFSLEEMYLVFANLF